jgi:hypothetical protein
MCQESSWLKSEEIQMPIKAADSRKYSPAGEFYNRNPQENCVSRSQDIGGITSLIRSRDRKRAVDSDSAHAIQKKHSDKLMGASNDHQR